MAITKTLARKGRLDIGINYVLNGDNAALQAENKRRYPECKQAREKRILSVTEKEENRDRQ